MSHRRDNTNAVVNLHYADDTLIFGKAYLAQAMIQKWILLCYEKWPWLNINYHKSALIFIVEISAKSFLILLIFNCPIKTLPITWVYRLPLEDSTDRNGHL